MSMTLSQFQGKSLQEIFIFTANTVWIPPSNFVGAKAFFIAVGPGGGGAGNMAPTAVTTSAFPGAAGGGAGGAAIKEISLNTAASYTINIGTGGAGGSNIAATTLLAASGSGNTTVVSNDAIMNLQAGFGTAGKWSGNTKAASGAASGTANGGVGGSASGGDYNFTGGSAANANGDTALVNVAYNGQSIIPMNNFLYMTGGAGAGYYSNGANSTSNSWSGASSIASPIANDNTTLGLSITWKGGTSSNPNTPHITDGAQQIPGAIGYGDCGPGGYAGFIDLANFQNFPKDIANGSTICAGSGGMFAGGGGAFEGVPGTYAQLTCIGGSGGFGGGGGGAIMFAQSGAIPTGFSVIGGRGGNGIVIVKIVR